MSELLMDSKAGLRKLSPARALLSAEAEASVDLWFGHDVHYNSRPFQRTYGTFAPRYVGGRNQVLGGLYFQQVSAQIHAVCCFVQCLCHMVCDRCCLALLFLKADVCPHSNGTIKAHAVTDWPLMTLCPC